MPGSAKLVSWVAKGVTSGLDALFLTGFGSHRAEYWQTLYSTVVSLFCQYIIKFSTFVLFSYLIRYFLFVFPLL